MPPRPSRCVDSFRQLTNKAISDLLHLWHSRRCAVRLKAELTAAVYDKALRRKDASGLVAARQEDAKDSDGKKGKREDKTNADSGKIVNLMAGTSRILDRRLMRGERAG